MRRGEAGFTLLELIVALAIFGLLTTGLVATLRGTLGFYQRSASQQAATIDPAIARDTLRRELGSLMLARVPDGRGRAILSLQGTSDGLLLRSDLPEAFGGISRWLLLRQSSDAGGDHLVIRHFDGESAPPGTSSTALETSTLLDGVAGLRLAYLARPGPLRTADWLDQWTDQSELPLLIRIELGLAEPSGHSIPPLLVRPMVDASLP